MVLHDESNGMLTARQLARLLNVCINTVRHWDEQVLLKAYRVGPRGDHRYSREDTGVFPEEKRGAGQKVG